MRIDLSIKLTSYNVKDLFDNFDDPIKQDGPPKSDKLKKDLAGILKNLNSDIIALQEVENEQILNEVLSIAGLKDKYHVFVGKSDIRGIACALLIDKKYPVKSYIIHDDQTFARPPVEAIVELSPGFEVRVFSVHFKARMDEYSVSKRIKEAQRTIEIAKSKNIPTIIMGDYNDLPQSTVSKIFEENGFIDVRSIDKQSKDVDLPTFYRLVIPFVDIAIKSNIIDYIRVTNDLSNFVIQGSFDVLESREDQRVIRVSDHRPLSIKLNITKKE
ncbi:MAG: endonuclease/exonuclease/phosphatase family protein [bacterium]